MKKILILILAFLMIGLSGCVIDLENTVDEIRIDTDNFKVNLNLDNRSEIGDLKTHTKVIELDRQEELEVRLDVNAAKINISSTSDKLFEGKVETDIQNLIPIMELNRNKLVIDDDFSYNSLRNFTNDWMLKVTDKVPLSFDIKTNATRNNFDFTGLQIEDLKMNINAADTDIIFNEVNKADFKTFRLDLNAGSVEGHRLDYASVEEIDVKVNAGNVKLKFGENIIKDTKIYLDGNASSATVELPKDVGVSIERESNLVNIDISNRSFNKRGSSYTSRNYDTAKYIIDIVVTGAMFSVKIN